jgi:hypothetical protein
MRLSGLAWSGATVGDIKHAAKALLDLQRSDGGWGGNPHKREESLQREQVAKLGFQLVLTPEQ